MPAAKAGTPARRRTVPSDYLLFRDTTFADGSISRRYQVPGLAAPLDEPGFLAWRRLHVPARRVNDLISVLVIREVLDPRGVILTGVLERRRGSATGPFHGDPARVTFVGAAEQVRLYRATPAHGLQEVIPALEQRPTPIAGQHHFAGEEAAIRDLFGAATRIRNVRGPTLLEEMLGLSSIFCLCTPDGMEIDCGLGWHGTTPFLLRADFPRFEASPALPAAERVAIELAAAGAGLTTYEARNDADGPAVMARSNHDGRLYLMRADGTAARMTNYTPGTPPLTADQATWLRYAEAHEHLVVLDAYHDGRSDGVIVLAGAADGQVTRHLIDADGVEVWRAAADETAAAALHRAAMAGVRRR